MNHWLTKAGQDVKPEQVVLLTQDGKKVAKAIRIELKIKKPKKGK